MLKSLHSVHRRHLAVVLASAAAVLLLGVALPALPISGAALGQSIPGPLPGCSPFAGQVPAGQANPSDEPEPMGPIWCFSLSNSRTTRISGANDWIDNFDTNVSMGHLNDHEMGYRVIEVFNATPGFFKSGTFVQ